MGTGTRQRKRTISTTEILNEVERFSRRTISICAAPPPIADIDAIDDEEAVIENHPELKERDDALSISNLETIVHILKGNIGIGVLTLPMAIRNSGLIFGSIGLIFIAYLCVYCMMLLVNAAHRVNMIFILSKPSHSVPSITKYLLIWHAREYKCKLSFYFRQLKRGTSLSWTMQTRLVHRFK